MRALTVEPGHPQSARLDEVPSPSTADGALLVRTLAMGVCGTDREIVSGAYGWAPRGETRLILGHESLGEVVEAPAASSFREGDLVVGIVRRPDPVPCIACAAGEWDMCRNGRYTERGIKERHGYGSELFRIEPDFAIRLDPSLRGVGVLLEPTSVVAKAWDQVMRAGARSASWSPRRALITGAGPVGLLAALIGMEHGLDVHVFDRTTDGPKPDLVRALGATYHAGGSTSFETISPDIVIECTGASEVVLDAIDKVAATGIVCLAGVSSGGRTVDIDFGLLNRAMVLENEMVFGSVNANRRHYEMAAGILARADRAWLEGLISRRVALDDWPSALERRPDDIKVIIDFTLGAGDDSAH